MIYICIIFFLGQNCVCLPIEPMYGLYGRTFQIKLVRWRLQHPYIYIPCGLYACVHVYVYRIWIVWRCVCGLSVCVCVLRIHTRLVAFSSILPRSSLLTIVHVHSPAANVTVSVMPFDIRVEVGRMLFHCIRMVFGYVRHIQTQCQWLPFAYVWHTYTFMLYDCGLAGCTALQ